MAAEGDGGAQLDKEVATMGDGSRESLHTRVLSFVLRILAGPDKPKQLTLGSGLGPRVLLGTSTACELRLTDPKVSRRHATLELTGLKVRLSDHGSTNGTFVNGLQVREALLKGGETIQVGDTKIELKPSTPSVVTLPAERAFGRVLGASRAMRRLFPLFQRLAESNVPVVIEGETGCGKEVLAESLHERGPRAKQRFVVFDCTTVAANLIESALFGHERGAFTGATDTRRGVFEQADGGTLLIDEIGDLDKALQTKLLRAIQRSEVQRVGGEKWIKVDVRVLAATRRDLDREVQAGRFREDLFFRLMVARVELPPLRERSGDVPLLATTFWRELGGEGEFPPAVLAAWEGNVWPGNVRELYNAVARLLALGDASGPSLRMGAVATHGGADAPAGGPSGAAEDYLDHAVGLGLPLARARELVLREFEQRYVKKALADHGGSVTRAAEAAGVGQRYFHILRAKLGRGEDER